MATFRGYKACSCLAKWLKAYEAELLRVGEIKHSLDVYQLIGTYSKSGGTHQPGGAFDIGQYSTRALTIARQMGAATWHRTPAQGFIHHAHGVLKGCPHNSGGRYQIGSLEAGKNGLANGGKDDGPRTGIKFPLRTWTQGIAWAKVQAKPVKPPKPVARWHSAAFLNIWGDDGGEGQASVKTRLPKMVDDITEGRPEVIGFCEVRDEHEPLLTRAMKAAGYKRAGYSHRLALYVLPTVEIGRVSFYRYRKQNKGATEGMLRVRLKVNGHWAHYGVTHLDYRNGFDTGRVTQIKQGISSLWSMAKTYALPSRASRTIILTDANSTAWVTDKALTPAGFKVAAKAVIDFIYVGKTRPVIDDATEKTSSDHPIVRATFGKYLTK